MANSVPVIGIPATMFVEAGGWWPGMMRAAVTQAYTDAVQAAGGAPIFLPIAQPGEIALQLRLVDGLLVPGGPDVSPQCYGEEPSAGLGEFFYDMDVHQLALIRGARALGKPILGICRGIQLLNVAFGGTLIQDLAHASGDLIQHTQKGLRHAPSHAVDLQEGSRLARIFNRPRLMVNSFHHQALKQVASCFSVTGKARDGIVEGMEADGSFMIGVQWHPEGMVPQAPEMNLIFQALVQACVEGS